MLSPDCEIFLEAAFCLANLPSSGYQTDHPTLCNGNCLEILNNFQQEIFYLIFVDLFCNVSNNDATCHAVKQVSLNTATLDITPALDKYHEFRTAWLKACKLVLKPMKQSGFQGLITVFILAVCAFM